MLNKKAFTLIELLVVITILASLATVSFISLTEHTAVIETLNKDCVYKNRVAISDKTIECRKTDLSWRDCSEKIHREHGCFETPEKENTEYYIK